MRVMTCRALSISPYAEAPRDAAPDANRMCLKRRDPPKGSSPVRPRKHECLLPPFLVLLLSVIGTTHMSSSTSSTSHFLSYLYAQFVNLTWQE